MLYTVYQSSARKSDEYYTRMNTLGRDEACKKYPLYGKLDMLSFFGTDHKLSPEIDEEILNDYEVVAKVEASGLDDVFRIMNVWDDESAVERIAERIWSLSVGDMVETPEGKKFIVDGHGWYEV